VTSSLRLERVWQISGDEILREYGSERDSIEGEERERIKDRESLEMF